MWKTTTQHKTWQRPKWRGRKTKGNVTVSNGNRGFLEKVAWMKRREGKVCKIERGSCVHGAWVVASTVQELVCFSLKKPRGSAEIQKPVNLQHKNSVGTAPSKWQFHSISVHYWITEARMQIRQHKTACMCSEYIWMCVFLWDRESPKVGTGQPSHPRSVFLPKGKIGPSGEFVNNTLQRQTHKSRYGGLGVVNTRARRS